MGFFHRKRPTNLCAYKIDDGKGPIQGEEKEQRHHAFVKGTRAESERKLKIENASGLCSRKFRN